MLQVGPDLVKGSNDQVDILVRELVHAQRQSQIVGVVESLGNGTDSLAVVDISSTYVR